MRSVLVVDPNASVPAGFAACLRPRGYFCDAVGSGAEALELACSLPFDVVIVVVDGLDTGLRDLIRRVRRPDSASQATMMLTLADGPAALPARELLGCGVDRVLPPDTSGEDLARAVQELVEASPRVPLKAVIRFRLRTGTDEKIAMCQTEDVSATGVFVRTEITPPAGAHVRFELVLPGHIEPIRGDAEVARHISGRPDRAPGLGLRFLQLDGEGTDKLRAWLVARSAESR